MRPSIGLRGWAMQAVLGVLSLGASAVAGATSELGVAARQSLDDAWWTGPLLAPAAGTLPRGHWLVEPYFYDVAAYGHFDRHRTLQSSGASHTIGNQSYIEYGLVDRFTLGLIPRLGFHESTAGQDSAGFAVGDLTLQGAYGLTPYQPDSWMPVTALVIGETFPIGRYDRLSGKTDGALGSGAYSTTVSLYSQKYFWLPNGRILRTRFDVSYSISQWASVHGQSVYGTLDNFIGRAHPGPIFTSDLAFEYSATRNWVVATDIWWEHDGNTRVEGDYYAEIGTLGLPVSRVQDFGSSEILYLAPALEYNWSPTMGIIAGVRVAAAGRSVTATVTPVAAVNMVF